MNTGDIIKKLRIEKNLSQEELGRLIGVQKAAINKYEKGLVVNLKRDVIAKLADALGTTPTVIMGWEDDDSNEIPIASNIFPLPQTYKVPRIGTIACGTPILAAENIEEYDFVPVDIKCDFTLRCKGDSMIGAGINDGDVVYIHKQCTVENGQIAAIIIDEEATLKRFYHNGDMVQLVAENPAFPPMVFMGEEINQLRIAGRAIAYTHVL